MFLISNKSKEELIDLTEFPNAKTFFIAGNTTESYVYIQRLIKAMTKQHKSVATVSDMNIIYDSNILTSFAPNEAPLGFDYVIYIAGLPNKQQWSLLPNIKTPDYDVAICINDTADCYELRAKHLFCYQVYGLTYMNMKLQVTDWEAQAILEKEYLNNNGYTELLSQRSQWKEYLDYMVQDAEEEVVSNEIPIPEDTDE
ncbi:hypothetical protein [Vibrio fortis]|uniref:hypothetical protein n=1 Tax=Vibrio fortis TaxID=212667 RepID=UPI0038CD5520